MCYIITIKKKKTSKIVKKMKGRGLMKKNISNVRRTVCLMANSLVKVGYNLSEAFKKAWRRVKAGMTIRTAGTSFENRQELLSYISQYDKENLSILLLRDKDNAYDKNAVGVVVYIRPVKKYAVIGYVPKGLAQDLAKVIDAGIEVKCDSFEIIGGYSYKEHYGALLTLTV